MRFLLGIPVIIIGFLLIWKTEWMINNWGRIEWAEEHLESSGGTRFFYKIVGLVLIFGAYLAMSGLLQSLISGIFGPLFGNI